jgi:hypothetical protein
LCKQRYEIVNGITEVDGVATKESTEAADAKETEGN